MMVFSCRKKYINGSLSSSQTPFGCPTSSYEVEFATTIIKYLRWSYAVKISLSDGLVGNIVLPTRLLPTDVNGFLLSVIRICDSFLCFCDEL